MTRGRLSDVDRSVALSWRSAPVAPPRPARTARPTSPVRPEIQALRALAVALVVGYHLWPGPLPGGYVGVDVFFVVSGFLITQHIVRDLDAGTFTLARFYLRRARRLLPAAGVVLLSVSVATALLLPRSWWTDTSSQVGASLVYLQNWLLSSVDVGYLEPSRPPGPVRHFWSLSVEEQFYLLWPLLLLVVARLAAAVPAEGRRRLLVAAMAVLAAGSFAYGLWQTARNPADAYYSSPARAWEFAVGGLLGLLPGWDGRPRVRAGLAWAGLAAIAAAGLGATGSAGFPGWAALLPVAGALAVLAAGVSPSRWYPSTLVRARPAQLAGDLSYSIYLWHWPLIVLWPFVPGAGPLDDPARAAVIGLSVALAGLTKYLVEDRFRRDRPGAGRSGQRRFAGFTAAVLALTLAVSGGLGLSVVLGKAGAQRLADRALAEGVPCFGALAMASGPSCEPPYGDRVTPDPLASLDQFHASRAYRDCFAGVAAADVLSCSFGPADAPVTVALFGDSHALHWFPALQAVADARGWRIKTYLRAACPANLAPSVAADPTAEAACGRWVKRAVADIAADDSIDLVVTSTLADRSWRPQAGLDGFTTGVEGYRRTWHQLVAGGRRHVLVLADTPQMRPDTPTCVQEHGAAAPCGRPRAEAFSGPLGRADGPDALLTAAILEGGPAVRVADLTDAFCDPVACPAVIGNVLVFADDDHMTVTFARSLAPLLSPDVVAALPQPLD